MMIILRYTEFTIIYLPTRYN